MVLSATGGNWRIPLLLSIVLLGAGALVTLRIDPRRRVVGTAAEGVSVTPRTSAS
jgi:hypothetical protein